MPLLFFSEVYMEHTEYIAHLQGIVQIPTVSSVNDASTDWSEFDRLHRFLQEAYPLISKSQLSGRQACFSTGSHRMRKSSRSSSWRIRM